MAGYWDKVLHSRLSRRRALAASGGAALGAAILSACGGGGDDGGGGQQVSELLYKAEDTTKLAKHGGTFRGMSSADPANWDYYNFDPVSQGIHNGTGIKLLRMKAGHLQDPALEIEVEAAEKYEYSGDKLTLTFKLNPKAKFQPQSSTGFHSGVPASVFNRQIDADDVVFSLDRLSKTASATFGGRGELFYSVNKNGPIESFSAIDKSTVQLKLHHPSSALLTAFANPSVSYPYIIPKEGKDNAIDFLKTQIGGGLYYVEKYEPSVNIVLKRNPNYEALFPDLKPPFFDTIDQPRIVDPAQQLAQFRAGNLFNGPIFGPVDDRLTLKREVPELLAWTFNGQDPNNMYFGQHKDNPFVDVRVRRAMSYAWDRDTHVKIIYSTDKLEAAGIPANVRWANTMSSSTFGPPGGTFVGYWMDPKSKEFGAENTKWFTLGDRQKDIAEAKALIKAATGKDVLEFEHIGIVFAGFNVAQNVAVMDGIIQDAGFKPVTKPMQFGDFLAFRNTNPAGNWKGVVSAVRYGPTDPVTHLFAYYHRNGGLFGGYSASGVGAAANAEPDPAGGKFSDGSPLQVGKGDPEMNTAIEKMYAEFDEKKRQSLVHDFARYNAKMNYLPMYPGGAATLAVGWPAVENRLGWQSGNLDHFYRYIWLNDQKAPLKRA
jgi:ABC-type transport system substrate-binding protein